MCWMIQAMTEALTEALTQGVILSEAAFQAERRISRGAPPPPGTTSQQERRPGSRRFN
jgi:hypothetical protein